MIGIGWQVLMPDIISTEPAGDRSSHLIMSMTDLAAHRAQQ